MSYTFEVFRRGCAQQVAELQHHLWGPSVPRNLECFDWKYARNPYMREPLIYLARNDGQLVGMRGAFGACWTTGDGEASHIPCAADTVIAPEYRDSGLFADLTGFAMEDLRRRGYRFLMNLSASRANYLTSVITMGWRSAGSLGLVLRATPKTGSEALMRNVARQIRQRASGGGRVAQAVDRALQGVHAFRKRRRDSAAQDPFEALDRLADSSSIGGMPISISAEPRPADMADAVERLGDRPGIRHRNDEAYFSWRFQNPRSAYRFLFWDDGQLEGYLVVASCNEEEGIAVVAWEGDNPEIIVGLLEAALSDGKFPIVRAWRSASSPAHAMALDDAGFAEVPDARHSNQCMLRRVDAETGPGAWQLGGRDLLDVRSWGLQMIDSDAL